MIWFDLNKYKYSKTATNVILTTQWNYNPHYYVILGCVQTWARVHYVVRSGLRLRLVRAGSFLLPIRTRIFDCKCARAARFVRGPCVRCYCRGALTACSARAALSSDLFAPLGARFEICQPRRLIIVMTYKELCSLNKKIVINWVFNFS